MYSLSVSIYYNSLRISFIDDLVLLLCVRIGILFVAVLRFGLYGLIELGLAFLGRAELYSSDLSLLYSNFLINSIILYLTSILPILDA